MQGRREEIPRCAPRAAFGVCSAMCSSRARKPIPGPPSGARARCLLLVVLAKVFSTTGTVTPCCRPITPRGSPRSMRRSFSSQKICTTPLSPRLTHVMRRRTPLIRNQTPSIRHARGLMPHQGGRMRDERGSIRHETPFMRDERGFIDHATPPIANETPWIRHATPLMAHETPPQIDGRRFFR